MGKKSIGDNLNFAVDVGSGHSGLTDVQVVITDQVHAAIATVPLIENGTTGQYSASYTTVQAGLHRCRLESATLGVHKSKEYDVAPVNQSAASIAAGVAALQTPIISISFA